MVTAIAPVKALADVPDSRVIALLVGSHGDLNLAAERISKQLESPVSAEDLRQRLPSLPYDELLQSVKASRLLQTHDAFTVMLQVAVGTLQDLNPAERFKFFIQFMDRFQVMVEPPVQGGSGQAASSSVNINLNSPEAQSDARTALASRLIDITSERLVRDVQTPDSAGEAPTSEQLTA